MKPSMLARASRGRTDHDAKWPVNIPSGFFTVAKPALPALDACSRCNRPRPANVHGMFAYSAEGGPT